VQLADQDVLFSRGRAGQHVTGGSEMVRRQGLVVPAKSEVMDDTHPVLADRAAFATQGRMKEKRSVGRREPDHEGSDECALAIREAPGQR